MEEKASAPQELSTEELCASILAVTHGHPIQFLRCQWERKLEQFERYFLRQKYSFQPLIVCGKRVLQIRAKINSPLYWLSACIQGVCIVVLSPLLALLIIGMKAWADVRGHREYLTRDDTVKNAIWDEDNAKLPLDYTI